MSPCVATALPPLALRGLLSKALAAGRGGRLGGAHGTLRGLLLLSLSLGRELWYASQEHGGRGPRSPGTPAGTPLPENTQRGDSALPAGVPLNRPRLLTAVESGEPQASAPLLLLLRLQEGL